MVECTAAVSDSGAQQQRGLNYCQWYSLGGSSLEGFGVLGFRALGFKGFRV